MLLIDAIEEISKGNYDWKRSFCLNLLLVQHVSCEDRERATKIFKEWPLYSGNENYPIPCPETFYHLFEDDSFSKEDFAEYIWDYFFMSDDLSRPGLAWDRDHPYGSLRWNLINFTLDYLKQSDS